MTESNSEKASLIYTLKIDPDKKARPQGRSRRFKKWAILTVVLLLVAGFFVLQKLLQPPQVEVVRAEIVQQGLPEVLLSAGGYVVADSTILVSSQVNGKIESVAVEEGDVVKKGDLLATIEDDDYLAKYQMAKAEYELAAATLRRKSELYRQQFIPKAEHDEAFKTSEVKRAALESARYFFENTQVRAPIDGTIIKKEKEPGEFLLPGITSEGVPGSAVMKIADLRVINVEIDVLESDLAKIKLGQPCMVFPDAQPNRSYPATLFYIAPQADRQKSVIKLKVRIEKPDEWLKPEMSARVYFLKEAPTQAVSRQIVVPASALSQKDHETSLFIVQKDQLLERKVEVSSQKDGKAFLRSGLEGDEAIVSKVKPRFKNGMKVIVKSAPES